MEEWCNFSSYGLGKRFLLPPALNPFLKYLTLVRLRGSRAFPVFQCLRGQLQQGDTSVSYTAAIHSLIVHLLLPRGWDFSPLLHYFDSFSEKGVTALPTRAAEAKNIK